MSKSKVKTKTAAVNPLSKEEAYKQAEVHLQQVQAAFESDALLRVSQTVLFAAKRLTLVAMLVIKQRLRACGVSQPDVAIMAMMRDEELINDTIGPFSMDALQSVFDDVLPTYLPLLAESHVTLASLEDDHEPGQQPVPDSGTATTTAGDTDSGTDTGDGH
jgi:hypothetical protein